MTILRDIQYDVFDPEVVYDGEFSQGELCPPVRPAHISASDEALVACINAIGRVDLAYMSESSGLPVERLVADLHGTAIFQDPDAFQGLKSWDKETGWQLAPRYLSGNIVSKYTAAVEAEKRFPGCFERNVEALSRLLPEKLDLSQIHVSLGAPWIPEDIYAEFIKDLLKLPVKPTVYYNKQLAVWRLEKTNVNYSPVENRTVYGTPYMSAIEIIEQTMNARTVKVVEPFYSASFKDPTKPVYVVNRAKTQEAQDKQRTIIREFEQWVMGTPRRVERLQKAYNETYVGFIFSPYDGSFLSLPGLNPDVRLFRHQRNAVARILLSGGNVLLSHDVGTGKTYEMIVAAHELKRMGLSEKNLVVVPNNVLQDFENAHKKLYPDDDILVVHPKKDFIPAKRDETLSKVRDGDYVCIYMAYSSFNMLRMSKEHYVEKMRARIRELQTAASNSSHTYEAESLRRAADQKQKELGKYVLEAKDTAWLPYDKLGVTTLYLDEAHNYKNVPVGSRTDNIVGMNRAGSDKCREMSEKCANTERLVFATGTPLTNSLADMFVIQSYLQKDELDARGIGDFDMWINTFGERETNFEIDVTAASLRTVTRFSSFHNLTELMGIFSTVCDFHRTEVGDENLPRFEGSENVMVDQSPAQHAYIQSLAARADAVRNPKTRVKRKEDNLLKITTDGRKCALDIRLVDLSDTKIRLTKDDLTSTKTRACAEQVRRLYDEYPGTCQLVFSDLGTPKSAFNVYDALRAELEKLGIPEKEIAFVHDAVSDSARDKLFKKMNKGELRVVVGSTEKLGIGVNVQERLIAIHHLSVPWRPSDMVQREGRLIRRGNTCEQVFVYRYITQGSFDSYSWQILENKQRFISNFLSGISGDRDQDDIADTALSYAEVKGLAIGNPLIRTRVEKANELERVRNEYRHRQSEILRLQDLVQDTPNRIRDLKARIGRVYADRAALEGVSFSTPMAERIAFGQELILALGTNVLHADERRFDTYQGFDVLLPAAMLTDKPYVLLKGPSGEKYRVDMEGAKEAGCSTRVDNVLKSLPNMIQALKQQIRDAKRNCEAAEAELEKGNPVMEKLERIQKELDEIDRKIEEQSKAAS